MKIILLVIGALIGLMGFAQEKLFVNVQKFGDSQGLSSPNARKIVKDKFNLFWIATQDGLNRFDGNNFLVYNTGVPSEDRETPGNDFTDIMEDTPSSILWAVNSNGGVSSIDLITSKITYRSKLNTASLHCNPVNIICTDNFVVVLTNSSNIFLKRKEEKGRFRQISALKNKAASVNIQKGVFIIQNTILLFLTDGSLILLDIHKGDSIQLAPDNNGWGRDIKVNSVVKYGHDIYTASNKGLFLFHFNKINLLGSELVASGNIISAAVNSKCLIYSSPDKVFYNNLVNASKSQLVYSGLFDKTEIFKNIYALGLAENSVLLGGTVSLYLVNKTDNPFTKFYNGIDPDIPPLKHVAFLDFKNDSIVRFCDDEGIGQLNVKTSEVHWFIRDQSYMSFFNINKDELLVSGVNSTKIINTKTGKVKKTPEAFAFLKGDFIISLYKLSDSTIYFATYKSRKLYCFKASNRAFTVKEISTPSGSEASWNVNNIVSYDGLIYFICVRDIGIYNPTTNTFKLCKIKCPDFPDGVEILMDLCKVKNHFYLAVYGYGIIKTDMNFEYISTITNKNSVRSIGFYKIINADDNLVFASSNNGLTALDIQKNEVTNFTENNGLHGNNFEESSGSYYNGNLIWGGINGVTKLDITRFKNNVSSKPFLYFDKVNLRTDKDSWEFRNLDLKKVDIPSKVTSVVLSFLPVYYENPLDCNIQYRIIQISDNWINNGRNNDILLFGLSPGVYNLEVRVKANNGINSDIFLLKLVFLPKWYQTWWFKLLVLLSTGSVIYAFYRYRINQIKKQHEIRKNIATDLHDDLGSTLNSVKVFTNLAISGVKQEESLQQVKDNLTEATMSLRDMIWVLDDSLDTVEELITRLKQFAIPVAGASYIEAVIKADSDISNRHLTKEEKRNLFLICKEAINNSIKYSGASQIHVSITANGKKIQIAIDDNGKGFNVDEVKKGYGLKNMQYRAAQLKYRIFIDSTPEQGTRVLIKPM